MARKKKSTPFEWRDWAFDAGEMRSWRLGPMHIWAALQEGEWKISWKRDESLLVKKSIPPLPPGSDWERWTAPQGVSSLRLSPGLPDLPMVARPEVPFMILPSELARIYVSTPVWVRVLLADDSGRRLVEIPSVILSKTWSGTLTEGTVAYWTRTRARRNHDPSMVPDHIVTSPVTLENKSSDPLPIEKIHLRLPHLSVYDHSGALWTDSSYIAFKGAGEFETVQEKGEPPSECPGAVLLTGPRTPPRTGLAALSFSPLKAITELDF